MKCTKPSSPYIAMLLITLSVSLIRYPNEKKQLISVIEAPVTPEHKLTAEINSIELEALKNSNHE